MPVAFLTISQSCIIILKRYIFSLEFSRKRISKSCYFVLCCTVQLMLFLFLPICYVIFFEDFDRLNLMLNILQNKGLEGR